MELLLGAVVMISTEIIKLLAKSKKISKELATKIVYGSLFVLCFIATYLTTTGAITQETIMYYGQMLTSAVGAYQLIMKPLKSRVEIKIKPKDEK